MFQMKYQTLYKAVSILAVIVLAVVILVYAKPFLVPLTFAAVFSMLLLPVSKWLQSKGINKAFSVVLSILVFVGFFALIIFFISWQISDIAENTSKIEQQVTKKYQQL